MEAFTKPGSQLHRHSTNRVGKDRFGAPTLPCTAPSWSRASQGEAGCYASVARILEPCYSGRVFPTSPLALLWVSPGKCKGLLFCKGEMGGFSPQKNAHLSPPSASQVIGAILPGLKPSQVCLLAREFTCQALQSMQLEPFQQLPLDSLLLP